jgi:VanZ family protein
MDASVMRFPRAEIEESMALQRFLRWILWPTLAFTTFMALSPSPPLMPTDRLGDKFTHMTAFAVLTLIARMGYPGASSWRTLERMALFGALIEVFQAIPSLHRTCDWRDWLADMIATSAVLLIHGMARGRLSGQA